jgi:hypothetical protein
MMNTNKMVQNSSSCSTINNTNNNNNNTNNLNNFCNISKKKNKNCSSSSTTEKVFGLKEIYLMIVFSAAVESN